jgi:hypothetical protein
VPAGYAQYDIDGDAGLNNATKVKLSRPAGPESSISLEF